MRIALIGCGTLGSYIARAVHNGVAGDHQMVSVLDTPMPDGMDAADLTEPQEVFSANAVDGIARFPKNVNVAASASLATSGP